MQACRSGVTCDALVISGHFDDGSEFYTDRFENREALPVEDLQQASCSDSCGGLFSQLKEVYLFGCNTLKTDPRRSAGGEVLRSLQRGGMSQPEAQRVATKLSEHFGESNRDRLRQIFKDVPVLYGFSSKARWAATPARCSSACCSRRRPAKWPAASRAHRCSAPSAPPRWSA